MGSGMEAVVAKLIVGCYTPGVYAEVAREHLIRSVQALKLPHVIREIPSRGSWLLNNSACQLYLRDLDREFPNDDFLYCDVDAVVHSNPWPYLDSLDSSFRTIDLAVYFLKHPDGHKELLSGTLYLPSNVQRSLLLETWCVVNEMHLSNWDQRNLQDILEVQDTPFRVVSLPPEYCCVYDKQRLATPGIVPVIEHFQASRKYKDSSWKQEGGYCAPAR